MSAVSSDRDRPFSDIDVSFNGRSVSKPNLGFKCESDTIVKRKWDFKKQINKRTFPFPNFGLSSQSCSEVSEVLNGEHVSRRRGSTAQRKFESHVHDTDTPDGASGFVEPAPTKKAGLC